MNITQAKRYVSDTVRAYTQLDEDGMCLLEPRLQRPLFLVGPPGIGKTAIMEQVAAELGIGLVAYSMTHHTRQSALGLPVIEHHSYKGFEYDASEYTMSEIIASVYAYMRKTGLERGILFLDEVNCVSETLYPSMLQFLQFKTFGAHAVPDGWIIVCAGNPPEYNRSVHEFDVATLDRIRKIEVEPDLEAWRAYAADAGVHAAVTTFLETSPDCFYRIQKTPDGTSFATARGWDDLGRMIALHERIGASVEQELVEQFVQDAEAAEKFSLYYELYRKYRSDYQIPAILAGSWPAELTERARAAQLDERFALLGLLMDTLSPQADELMVQEDVLKDCRDRLREAKPAMLEGASSADALGPSLDELAAREQLLADAGLRQGAHTRTAKRARALLKSCIEACAKAGIQTGAEAFSVVHQEFRGHAGAFEADVAALRGKVDAAFAFLEEAFGEGRETLLFTTELAARKSTALFIARYGSEGFARHNRGLQLAENRADLLERMEAAQRAAGDAPLARGGGGAAEQAQGALDTTAHAHQGKRTAAKRGSQADGDAELSAYYAHACWEYGYASLCHVTPPADLEGKTLLDIGCRRGKGAFKFSEHVGARGLVIGVDWVAEHIEEARRRSERAARETGLAANNMEFHLAYPENLMAAGLGDETIDVAFVNSVLHLTCRPAETLSELARVLKPGGLLVLEVALADAPRDPAVVAGARALGNSIQAAPFRGELDERLATLGFEVEVAVKPHAVKPNQGFKRDYEVPCAPSEEKVSFEALVLHAHKR